MKRFIALFFACAFLLCGCQREKAFTSARWEMDPENRVWIIDNLLENYPLVGMSEAEVLELLGTPDNGRTDYFEAENRFVYCLGTERGMFGIDCEWLLLDFEDGVVTARTHTHD
ncbi:MAG: outer membrane protein assembly factor BamE [Ruminococcaceae bacterium]|nr:outer membrane protein assembly factor BamE [Oscillospiraceae bacterium]